MSSYVCVHVDMCYCVCVCVCAVMAMELTVSLVDLPHSVQYIYDAAYISALQSQVVNGRQLFRHSIRAHFTYRVGGKHCKRMASLYKHMGNTLGGISPI